MTRLLLAEDERQLAEAVAELLRYRGYETDIACDGEEALRMAEETRYDGILLDIMMPKKDGLAVLRALRAQGDVTPVLMLTAKAEVEDRVAGLEQGANDYLTKPFSGKELAARIHAMLRTREELAPQKIYLSNVCANREELALEGPGGSVRLSVREFLLLELLTRSPGKPLTRAEAVEKLWSGEGDEAAAEINADYLRHKLRAVGAGVRLTETEDGVWRLESAPPDGSCGQKAFASPA